MNNGIFALHALLDLAIDFLFCKTEYYYQKKSVLLKSFACEI